MDCPASPEEFGATLFHALDIASGTRISSDGFSALVSTVRAVTELFRRRVTVTFRPPKRRLLSCYSDCGKHTKRKTKIITKYVAYHTLRS